MNVLLTPNRRLFFAGTYVPKETLTAAALEEALSSLRQSYDSDRGGFGTAPNFPRPHALTFLAQRWHRNVDSETVEGKFYVWTRAELLEILGPEGRTSERC